MARQLEEMRYVAEMLECCILCAGDVFDRWNSPPSLINFAMEHVPNMLSIAGQHDLPYHNYELLQQSAYYTLVKARMIENMEPEGMYSMAVGTAFENTAHSYPFGYYPEDKISRTVGLDIAVIHDYCWMGKCSYPGADPNKNAQSWAKHLRKLGLDCAVFGDNHKGFRYRHEDFQLINCGTFFRRSIDEKDYQPVLNLLCQDNTVLVYEMDCYDDKVASKEEIGSLLDESFIESLADKTTEVSQDFGRAIRHFLRDNKIGRKVRRMLIELMEDSDNGDA